MAGNLYHADEEGDEPISAINVTPFVDVVLVLLVIFMVTAPMIMKDVLKIRLPKTSTGDGKQSATLAIAITKSGNILLNGVLSTQADLQTKAKELLKESAEAQAIISADRETMHGDVVKVIDWLKTAGLERFAVQVEHVEREP